MKNKIIKILIVLFVFILSSLTLNKAFASYSFVYSIPATKSYVYEEDPCFISSFTASDTNINKGDSVKIKWSTEGCDNVRVTNIGDVGDSGSAYVRPEGDTTYRLTASSSDYSNHIETLEISVTDNSSNVGSTSVNNNSNNTSSTSNKSTGTTINRTTSTSRNVNSSNNSNNYSNNNSNSNDSVYGGGRDVTGSQLTALAVGGSGSFMPSSIWQWIIVTFLILIIIILIRIVARPRGKMNTAHA